MQTSSSSPFFHFQLQIIRVLIDRPSDIRDCAKMLASFHAGAAENKLRAVYRKYSNPERGAVALFPPPSGLLPVPV